LVENLVSETPMLIAEMCQNHNGRLDILEEMVRLAGQSGASHAKIQGIYSSELVFRERFELGGDSALTRPFQDEQSRLTGLDLSIKSEMEFVRWCDRYSLTPMITVFTHAGLDRAVAAGFRSFKIASYDCGSRALIERCLHHASELVISTGGTEWVELLRTVELLRSAQNSVKIRLLHAVTKYPTSLHEVNLARMLAISIFGFPVGFSDHTAPAETGLIASEASAFLGATAIERHFSILDSRETRDGPVSVSPVQLREISDAMMCDGPLAREKFRDLVDSHPEILATTGLEPSEAEKVNADYYRGRFASWSDDAQVMAWEAWGGAGP
jgi:N,N'-diacetyllegionaminate synthase